MRRSNEGLNHARHPSLPLPLCQLGFPYSARRRRQRQRQHQRWCPVSASDDRDVMSSMGPYFPYLTLP